MDGQKICPQCKTIQSADTAFCSNCGADIRNVPVQGSEPTPKSAGFCPNCGKPVGPNTKFCASCGAAISQNNTAENPVNTQAQGAPAQPAPQAPVYNNPPPVNHANPAAGNSFAGSNYFDQPEITIKDKYLSYRGRLNRKPYLLRGIILSVGNTICATLGSADSVLLSIISICLNAVLSYSSICLAIRRCHDKNHSGWWMLIPFYLFWLIFSKGTDGPNKYGPDVLPEDRGF